MCNNGFFAWLTRYKVIIILSLIFICLNILYYPINIYSTHIEYPNAFSEEYAEIISKRQIMFFVASLILYLFAVLVLLLNKVKIEIKALKVLFIVLICANAVLFLCNVLNCFIFVSQDPAIVAFNAFIAQFIPSVLSVLVYYVAIGVIENRKRDATNRNATIQVDTESILPNTDEVNEEDK